MDANYLPLYTAVVNPVEVPNVLALHWFQPHAERAKSFQQLCQTQLFKLTPSGHKLRTRRRSSSPQLRNPLRGAVIGRAQLTASPSCWSRVWGSIDLRLDDELGAWLIPRTERTEICGVKCPGQQPEPRKWSKIPSLMYSYIYAWYMDDKWLIHFEFKWMKGESWFRGWHLLTCCIPSVHHVASPNTLPKKMFTDDFFDGKL